MGVLSRSCRSDWVWRGWHVTHFCFVRPPTRVQRSTSAPPPPSLSAPDTEYTESSSMNLLWYVKLRNKIRQISRKKALNGSDRGRLEHPASPASPATARSSSPCHPGSSILIDGHLEGLLTENQIGTGRESTEGGRCTSIFCTIACTDCCPALM